MHRLDRATSGILILVKNFVKAQEMAARIKKHDLRKEYVCRVLGEFPLDSSRVEIVDGVPGSVSDVTDDETQQPAILVDAPLFTVSPKIGLNRVDARGKESQTTFQRLSFNGTSSVVKCIPKTGRTHQIRVHLQFLGFPIMNDRFYNCPALWGPKNGAGGDLGGKSDEQLMEDAGKIHVVENYLDAEVYAQLVQKHGKEEGEEEDCREDGKVEEEEAEKRPKKTTKNDCEDREHGDYKRAKLDDAIANLEDESLLTRNDQKLVDKTDSTESTTKGPHATAESSDYDPTCKDCIQPTRDPTPQELVMFLHALRYSGPDFDFTTPMPDWALESWNEEEDWKLF